MSNAISQNATDLAVSCPGIENFDYVLAVRNAAKRNVRDGTNAVSSQMLNRNKLISKVCGVFRDNFPMLFSKRDENGNIIPGVQRIPVEYFSRIETEVDSYLDKAFVMLNRETLSETVRNVHRSAHQQYVQVRTLKDEREITWKEQLLSCHIDMRIQNRRLKDLDKANKLTPETEDKIRKALNRLAITEQNILTHLPAEERTTFTP